MTWGVGLAYICATLLPYDWFMSQSSYSPWKGVSSQLSVIDWIMTKPQFFTAPKRSSHDGQSGWRLGHPRTFLAETRPVPGERGHSVSCSIPTAQHSLQVPSTLDSLPKQHTGHCRPLGLICTLHSEYNYYFDVCVKGNFYFMLALY